MPPPEPPRPPPPDIRGELMRGDGELARGAGRLDREGPLILGELEPDRRLMCGERSVERISGARERPEDEGAVARGMRPRPDE